MSPAFYARLLGLLLLALSASGCKVLGMRTMPLEMLEARYESPESQYITVEGTRMHYRVEGNVNGPTLVLLHGVMASLHTWDGWVERLSSTYRIVRMDIPGFGLSENLASGDYTPEYAVRFFEQARQALGLDTFHLAGNSLGGFIAWAYAAQYPERVEKLILIDPIAYPQPLPRIIKFASGGFGGFMAQISSPRFIVKRNIRQVYGDPASVTDETIDRYHELLLREGHRESMVMYFRTLKKYSTDESIAGQVKRVKTPTLLMWGEQDRWVPIELIDRWKRDVDGIQVRTYAGGGHIPMEEYPEETARDAHAFLSGGALLSPRDAPSSDEEGLPSWGSAEAEAPDEAPAPAAPAPQKKKPAQQDEGMVGWGEFSDM